MVHSVCFSISDGSYWRLPYALKKQQQGYIFNNNIKSAKNTKKRTCFKNN